MFLKKENLLPRNVFLRHLWTIPLKCNLAMLLIIKPWRQGTSTFPLLPDSLTSSSTIFSFTWTIQSHGHALDLAITNNPSQTMLHFQSHWFSQLSPWPRLFSRFLAHSSFLDPVTPLWSSSTLWAIRPLTCFLPIPVTDLHHFSPDPIRSQDLRLQHHSCWNPNSFLSSSHPVLGELALSSMPEHSCHFLNASGESRMKRNITSSLFRFPWLVTDFSLSWQSNWSTI